MKGLLKAVRMPFTYVRVLAFAAVAAIGLTLPSYAAAQGPTLSTEVGVDITQWVGVVAAGIGLVVAAALAAYFVFLVIRVGMMWIRRLG